MSLTSAKTGTISFGSYELVEKVATGGMAEVYRARARRPGGITKVVCLKRIHPSLCADPSFVDMFVEEARLGLNLSHGNIVPVFDFGCIDGYHYLVMDYIEGHDLAEVMARTHIVSKPFPAELAAYVIIEVLEGLAYAHGRKDEDQRPLELVHRDVSPSNVMISRSGEVKILDFGIARSAAREFHTRTGVVKGKPGYMAPEQARGEHVDARVDIFACGVMLRELVTSERPSKEPGVDQDSSEPSEVVEDEDLAPIVDQALENDADDRFESAAEMRDALREFLATTGARPNPTELTGFVDSLFGAQASVPDWSHQCDAVDRHLAAIVDEHQAQAEASESSETETSPSTTEPFLHAETTEPMGIARPSGAADRPKRSWTVIALIVLLCVVSVGAAVWFAQDRAPPTEDPGPRPTPTEPPPSPAKVEFRTEPRGASIIIDEEPAEATTPVVLTLGEGNHHIELRLKGFVTLKRTVEAEAGQHVLFDTVLVPSAGTIVVTSQPPSSKVSINGSPRGETPATIEGLDRRRSYTVVISRPSFEDWSQELSFGDEERLTVNAELQRVGRPTTTGEGYLSVVASPWAEVLLDGRSIGETPIIRRSVRAGPHVLILRNAPRGVEVRRAVTVPVNDEVRVSVDLTRGKR